MPYPYPKYWDDPDAEAHVYTFLWTWEANNVSQRLTEPEAERSKVAEFGMTLEGSAAQWHAKHLPDSVATFEALKAKFLRLPLVGGATGTSQAILHHASRGIGNRAN